DRAGAGRDPAGQFPQVLPGLVRTNPRQRVLPRLLWLHARRAGTGWYAGRPLRRRAGRGPRRACGGTGRPVHAKDRRGGDRGRDAVNEAQPKTGRLPWPPLIYLAAIAIAVLLTALYPLGWI